MADIYTSAKEIPVEGASRTYIRWLITPRDGAKNFAMRYFRIEPDGRSPMHSHPYEHEIFILKGSGKLMTGGRIHEVSEGYFSLIKENEMHQFMNTGQQDLEFLCMIPIREDNIPADSTSESSF